MADEVAHIQIGTGETLVSLRERFAGLRGRRVLLCWHADMPHLRRKLDLVLLQREARRRAIQLALVADDADCKRAAAELNISAFSSVEESENQRWKRARLKVFLPRYHKPSADLPPEDLAYIARLQARQAGGGWRAIMARALVLLLLLAVTGATLALIVPSATVELNLSEQEISINAAIVADRKATALDLERGIIPAVTLRQTVEATATIPSSGTAWLESVSAAAVVIFSNLGADSVDIPRGTILGTSAGEPIIFETTADVVVPAGAGESVGATVVAMEGYRGVIGNVGAGMINTIFGALADRVSVINLAPSAGGEAPSVKVVTAEDRERLLESLRIQLQSLAFEQMRAALAESQVIIIESIQLAEAPKDWRFFSADVGTMTSELTLTMRAVVSALAVDTRFARAVAAARLRAAVPAAWQLREETIRYQRGPFQLDSERGQVTFTISAAARAVAALQRDELRALLAGRSLEAAAAALAAHEAVAQAQPPQLSLHPAGWQLMPYLPIRIDIKLREKPS